MSIDNQITHRALAKKQREEIPYIKVGILRDRNAPLLPGQQIQGKQHAAVAPAPPVVQRPAPTPVTPPPVTPAQPSTDWKLQAPAEPVPVQPQEQPQDKPRKKRPI